MEYYKNKVDWCPICDQGWVEILKDKKLKSLFVCCDECESRWEHPNMIKNKNLATSIFDTDIEIEEPSDEEIITIGWEKYIINN
ncbi:hypothetical protein [Bacillus sp. AFS053548]|uniref:hypothetical protein n=1 Tax=Bacillus sp. AFS053548 TaxID=2033505 RepID=UPI000BFC55F7|nr:hypothetical protein [Bacillus sp. AFS053548]PGM54189.1 hypothetical protein CN946_16440 [Bacillus sp. AFS053548]